MLATALFLALQVQSATPVPADSYADSATADLVAHARAARERNERLVTMYTARASQRIGVGIRALSRDRMLYRQELVAKITWRRDSVSTVEAIGAREGVPVAMRKDQVPSSLRGDLSDLVLDPASDYLKVFGMGDPNDGGFVYPLRDGGERDYRFAVGGTTTIGLPDGRKVRLVALAVIPRRADWKLMSGTLWFDADTYGLVRAAFRPARPFELRRDLEPQDQEDIPAWVNASGEVRFITLEYALYEGRWWMPRYVAIDGVGSMGSWLDVPLRIERVYDDYEVEGGTPPDPNSTFRPAGRARNLARDGSVIPQEEMERRADSVRTLVAACRDSVQSDLPVDADARTRRAASRECRRAVDPGVLAVIVPDDTLALLASDQLGPPILDMGDLISEDEIRSLQGAIGAIPDRPWETHLELPRGLGSLLQRARYNRIEALSLGLGGRLEFGKFRLDGIGRIGLADGEPNGELGLVRERVDSRLALTAYRRLATATPENHPFGAVNSFMALFAGRDDGEYFRGHGLELTLSRPGQTGWDARLYHEWQRPADVETSASLPRLFDGDRTFRPNIVAERATQTGAALSLRTGRPLSRSVSLGVEARVAGETGDFDFGKGSLTLRAAVIPGGPLAGGITLAAGTSVGAVPVQSAFFLGGAGSLRGYDGGAARGEAFWLGRLEVGNAFPAVRLIAFTDIGWAGARADFGHGRALAGAGIGASFLDGLVRIDLARALKAPTGTRLEIYLDGLL